MSNLAAAAAAMNAVANKPINIPSPVDNLVQQTIKNHAIKLSRAQQMAATQGPPIWKQNQTLGMGGSTAMKKIQIQIKTLRQAKGWSQRTLAYHSGMSQGTITRAERHGWISIHCLISIAQALGTELKLV